MEATWIRLGGPATLAGKSEVADVQVFFDLLEQSEEGGTVRDFSLLRAKLKVLYARTAPSEDCVKVMTIHTAKGLEFDTVILPSLGKAARGDQGELLIWSDNQVAAKPPRAVKSQAYDNLQAMLKARAKHEMKRLLYVAATRAKKQLFLLGSVSVAADRSDIKKPQANTFLDLLWPVVEAEFRSTFRRQRMQQQALPFSEPTPATLLRYLPAHWHAPVFDAAVQWTPRFQTSAASARTVTYEWVSDTGRHVGTVVHDALRRIAADGLEAWSGARVRSLEPLFRTELARLGVSEGEQPAAVQRVLRALVNTIESERGRWILGSHVRAWSEWAFGGVVG